MTDSTSNAKLDALLFSRYPGKEASLGVIAERTAERIPHLIAEGSDTVESVDMSLHCQELLRISTAAGAPSLSIDKDRRVDGIHGSTDGVHGLDIMDAHEVEAKTINVIFIDPVFHALHHHLSHQWSVAGCLIAATRTIGVVAQWRLTVEIVGEGALEVAPLNIESVIIHHVENHPDTRLMKRLHHLFKLPDTYLWPQGIGSI